jgi:hypothetical protein
VTKTVSADLNTVVKPCQLGGNPDCLQCGCLPSMGLHAIANDTLPIGIKFRPIFDVSDAIGSTVRRWWGDSEAPSPVVELPIRAGDVSLAGGSGRRTG